MFIVALLLGNPNEILNFYVFLGEKRARVFFFNAPNSILLDVSDLMPRNVKKLWNIILIKVDWTHPVISGFFIILRGGGWKVKHDIPPFKTHRSDIKIVVFRNVSETHGHVYCKTGHPVY